MIEVREEEIMKYIHSTNSLREIQIQMGADVNSLPPVLKREDIDLAEWKMIKSMDGCGPELIIMFKVINGLQDVDIIDKDNDDNNNNNNSNDDDDDDDDGDELNNIDEDEMQNLLPPHTTVIKWAANTSAFNQPSDTGKQHSKLKKENDNDATAYHQGVDEGKLPIYCRNGLVSAILVKHNFTPIRSRSTFKLICNFDKRRNMAYSYSTLDKANRIAGSPNDIVAYLKHWPAFNILTEEDYIFIEKIFYYLVQIALTHGTVHKEAWQPIMGKFIYDKHIEGLSDLGLHVIAMEEIKKPISQRKVVNWGTTIITNPGFMEQQREILLEKQEEELLRIENSKEKKIQSEINKIADIFKREQQEIKRLKKINRIETDATSIYNLYKSDYTRDDGIITWNAPKVSLIKNAYTYYCVPSIDKDDIETRKKPMVETLEEYFNSIVNEKVIDSTI
jgi:hypothetical protein